MVKPSHFYWLHSSLSLRVCTQAIHASLWSILKFLSTMTSKTLMAWVEVYLPLGTSSGPPFWWDLFGDHKGWETEALTLVSLTKCLLFLLTFAFWLHGILCIHIHFQFLSPSVRGSSNPRKCVLAYEVIKNRRHLLPLTKNKLDKGVKDNALKVCSSFIRSSGQRTHLWVRWD